MPRNYPKCPFPNCKFKSYAAALRRHQQRESHTEKDLADFIVINDQYESLGKSKPPLRCPVRTCDYEGFNMKDLRYHYMRTGSSRAHLLNRQKGDYLREVEVLNKTLGLKDEVLEQHIEKEPHQSEDEDPNRTEDDDPERTEDEDLERTEDEDLERTEDEISDRTEDEDSEETEEEESCQTEDENSDRTEDDDPKETEDEDSDQPEDMVSDEAEDEELDESLEEVDAILPPLPELTVQDTEAKAPPHHTSIKDSHAEYGPASIYHAEPTRDTPDSVSESVPQKELDDFWKGKDSSL